MNDCVCHGIPGPYVLKDGDIVNVDAVFGIFTRASRNRCMVIGRSDNDGLDVGTLMKSLGGGGHQPLAFQPRLASRWQGIHADPCRHRQRIELARDIHPHAIPGAAKLEPAFLGPTAVSPGATNDRASPDRAVFEIESSNDLPVRVCSNCENSSGVIVSLQYASIH